MSKFAEYGPASHSGSRLGPADGLTIRTARPPDLAQAARIVAEREGGEAGAHLVRLSRELEGDPESTRSAIWVAVLRDQVIGYAKAGYFEPPADSPPDTGPAGWYLGGLIVDPAYRRRGVGLRLIQARIDWIAQRSDKVYYFASARNLATIDLHARFGFREVARAFSFPGASFTGGIGILFDVMLARS